ncbi:Homeodomain [Penicillium argentinense]|uniref:Homeodomain n=1 Tax=Penicillium argentinense TaxID=1131581 RepID=A0A9W9K1W2_9EURO|nr:Homeodomain [Penicillium argentinense]KAJ5089626.1 Homeodomain [Penicillium argentinense]
MDPRLQPNSAPPRRLPESLPEPGLSGILDSNVPEGWLHENSQADWNALHDFYFCSSDPTNLEWSQFTGLDSHQSSVTSERNYSVLQPADVPSQHFQEHRDLTELTDISAPLPDLANVPQWLDGAHRPPVPCNYCRRHRLQCLIIRTTAANPNPVTACSSCVALFRECSLARGEKRHPSGFETFSPVLGHLHGLPEDTEDGGMHFSFEGLEDRKESKQFVRKGARVLREWFYRNQEYPYPTEAQKEELSKETGFSQKRVSTWFANARRRQKQKIQSSNQTSTSRSRAGSPLITSTLSSVMSPMERWKASPPEDEPVPESAIQDAIALDVEDPSPAMDPFHFDGNAMDLFNFDETSSHLASSASSFGSRASETSESVSSTWSYQSGGEGNMPFPLLPKTPSARRQRRKRPSRDEGQYECTFCTSCFSKRHDWARHEKSVHLQLDSWICTPNLAALQQQFCASIAECPFCDASYPTPAHWEEHEFHICAEKPTAERSFSRKDYLLQHLRKFHACAKSPALDLDAWRGSGGNVQSRCGFCDCSLPTWATRAEHIAAHFKKGARMAQWNGDWGLDVSAMSILRSAVLPSQRPQST